MTIGEIPWSLVVFLATQTFGAIWFISNLNSDFKNLKQKVDQIEKENENLRKEIKEMRDILIKVEHNTTLLMMGRIKTNARDVA